MKRRQIKVGNFWIIDAKRIYYFDLQYREIDTIRFSNGNPDCLKAHTTI